MARLVALGMLLVVLDPRLNSFDLLPDVLGWALVLAGLLDLRRLHPALRHTWWVAWPALVASALATSLFFSETSWPVGSAVVSLVAAICGWTAGWWVLVGLAALSIQQGGESVARGLAGRRLAVVLAAIGLMDVIARVVVLVLVLLRHRSVVIGGLVGVTARVVVLGVALAAVIQVFSEGRHHSLA